MPCRQARSGILVGANRICNLPTGGSRATCNTQHATVALPSSGSSGAIDGAETVNSKRPFRAALLVSASEWCCAEENGCDSYPIASVHRIVLWWHDSCTPSPLVPIFGAAPRPCAATAQPPRRLSMSVALPQDPVPMRPVNIYVSRDVAFNLEKITKVTAEVLNRLGCGQCHSGRILFFHSLEDFVVNPKTLAVEELGALGLRG